ncbi:anaerobic C4-dicarboxylate transporter [Halioglobus maricola]|uniref:C4-dicarboxylate transporter n=1 Tax=Halioglobus maricola TaxID=2601894 RepID=A0A5P9NF21_9GAMM|nr:anaerobic C4-dicarboxylate transporter family protein [Halioglobus maricola]QFU74350.1 anaerobic C4-dicarboxylate transporter [Halioglobus maricola]
MLVLELGILLTCILLGARRGGIALGTISGIGLVIFVFLFDMPPGQPPAVVLGMILAVITALAMMEAAGGLQFLVETAEKLLRRNPSRITFVAPLVTYLLIFGAGTQHVIYSLLPVIAEVSRKAGVRPERPLSISVIAAQQGLIASPISAVSVALVAALAGFEVGLADIMMVVIPATLVGLAVGTLSVAWRGAPLAEDSDYQARLKDLGIDTEATAAPLAGKARRRGAGACAVFLVSVALIVIIGIFPELRPVHGADSAGVPLQIDMAAAIMVIMLGAAGLVTLLFDASPARAMKGELMRSGLVAIISILGVSWLGASFFAANEVQIIAAISSVIETSPWLFALGLFVLSILLFSQAATIVILAPIGLALGLPPHLMVGLYPAVNGNFFLPTYGTVLAAVSFDRTGTTRIGKYVLNHSFMRPGLAATFSSTLTALALSQWLLG